MKCPNCQSESPDHKKFCGGCGTPLDGVAAKVANTGAGAVNTGAGVASGQGSAVVAGNVGRDVNIYNTPANAAPTGWRETYLR